MVRPIALFVTLATVLHAVTTKTQLDTALVWAVFGAPPPPTAPTERQKFPPLCATPVGETGDCVPRDHCTGDVKGAVTPGGDVTDTHGNHSKNNNDCPGYNHVCCPVYKRKQPHAVVDVQAVPVVKEEQNKEQESKSTCGTRVDEGGETPWLVIIKDPSKIWQSSDVYEGSVGGGALIHPSVVLTAAHVVYARLELQVLAGGADAQMREVDSVKVHELFNKHNAHNDIALVFLATPLDITPRVRVACLPRAAAVAPARCSATEWARSPHTGAGMVKTVDVPVVSHQECESKYRTTRLGPYFKLDKSFLCAGGEQRREVCRGDGGFPLTCPAEHTGRFVLFGVVAWDIECGQGAPTVHVDVAALRPWIDQEVASRGLATQSYTY